jgi:hypothetical protein
MSKTHVFGPALVSDFRFGWVQEDNYTTAARRRAAKQSARRLLLYCPKLGRHMEIPAKKVLNQNENISFVRVADRQCGIDAGEHYRNDHL